MPSKNIGTKTTFERLSGLLNTYYAKKSDLPTKLSDLTNDGGFISETSIDEKISAAIAGALIPGGSVLFANLPALTEANNNHIYNIEDAFTTTADFVEGAGKEFPAGTNVAIINTGTTASPVYKYDTYTGTVDYSVFMRKQTGATQNHFAKFDENGQAVDAGVGESDFLKASDIAGKADKVTGENLNGKLAGLDANGNLTNSGVDAADVQVKTAPAAAGNLASLNVTGELADSGVSKDNVQQKLASGAFTPGNIRTTDSNGFAQDGGIAAANLQIKTVPAAAGNLAGLNASGELTDSGVAASSVLLDTDISDYTEAELKALLGIPADD